MTSTQFNKVISLNMTKKPAVLMILDGWGHKQKYPGNAVAQANTPTLDYLMKQYPTTTIAAAGEEVGLPDGTMGNSEVGHQNIGAGRVVPQSLMQINNAVADGSFLTNEALNKVLDKIGPDNSLHLTGLLSDAGVHSDISHLFEILKLAKIKGIKNVYIHPIMDGRDAPVDSGIKYITMLQDKINELGIGTIATLSGRYFAMDRDNNGDRTKLAHDMLVSGIAQKNSDPIDVLKNTYNQKEDASDEFVTPTIIKEGATIKDHDVLMHWNFRADRARQLTWSFISDENFSDFERSQVPSINVVTMTQYKNDFGIPAAFLPVIPKMTLGEVVANAGLSQLRLAESEKYAHVTFFFNGGVETSFTGEERKIIDSPKDVEGKYDRKPEMSAFDVKAELLYRLAKRNLDLVVINFANMDMVGHTANPDATIKAIEAVDACVADAAKLIKDFDGSMLITADHGNAEELININEKQLENIAKDKNTLLTLLYKIINTNTNQNSTENSANKINETLNLLMKMSLNIRVKAILDILNNSLSPEEIIKLQFASKQTKHSTNPVPVILVSETHKNAKLNKDGKLADIAPTMLDLMELEKPQQMTGNSLIKNN